jgi:hypothetical protein
MDEDVCRVLGSLPTYLTCSILNNPLPGQIDAALDAAVVDKPTKETHPRGGLGFAKQKKPQCCAFPRHCEGHDKVPGS